MSLAHASVSEAHPHTQVMGVTAALTADPFAKRNATVAAFRRHVWAKCGYIPFRHQAEPILASEGWTLTNVVAADLTRPHETILVTDPDFPDDLSKAKSLPYYTVPRTQGLAHTIANLASYKVGKSFGAGALWAPGFAILAGATVQLVGLEYKTSRYEFDYLADTLLSRSGCGMKYAKYHNDPRNGRMLIELRNGMIFEGMSWERKEALKGAEVTAYLWNEAYMLPGYECINTTKQNLRKQKGFNWISTTPDRPWVGIFHDDGHGNDPDTHCTCGVDGSKNPHTFALEDMLKDCPDETMLPLEVRRLADARGLTCGGRMTRERFAISWGGKIGDFVGRCYNYQRGERVATPQSHPWLFRRPRHGEEILTPTIADVRLPSSATIIVGADTGTFMSALIVAVIDDYAVFLEEHPNYRYVGGEAELLDVALPEWTKKVKASVTRWTRRSRAGGWCDKNSQFKTECRRYGLALRGNPLEPEARTEIAREYYKADRVLYMPWLTVLPYETESARWPEDTSASGRYARVKENDHTLDCKEHALSRRPRKKTERAAARRSWIQHYLKTHQRPDTHRRDPHLGAL